ncbi:MAG TPA: helix-turn-helix transcriptional regulator, partial [Chloroflexaceae bacterium]|nr:helix-turn-helix transcriptional regulator [Chloroflexaceae bacterium]
MRHPNRIAYYRDRCDPPLTQTELARLLGVHPNTVQNWERDGVARASALLRLVRVFAERGALACYHDGLAFWRAAARGARPPPPGLPTLFVAAEAPPAPGPPPLP